jgi:hypothetical protein
MTLSRRLKGLVTQLPPPRKRGVPTDPKELLLGLIGGRVDMADFDRTDADQVCSVATAAALLVAWESGRGDRARAAGAPSPDQSETTR